MKSSILTAAILYVGAVTAYLVDPPTTAKNDTISDCTNWDVVASTDTCQSIADNAGITLAQFDT
jgi:hypothetical protein